MKRTRWAAVLLALGLVGAVGNAVPAPAPAPIARENQFALVIGNNQYASAPLQNPVNDSRAIAAKLREIGFHVLEVENLRTRQIPAVLREFRSGLQRGGVGLFFYAGHGVQIKGVNYLPAVDADIQTEEDVPTQAIDLNRILDMLGESKTRLNLLFLDACRNNPYQRSMRSAGTGLARVDAPSGTLISYATRPGSTASDGTGAHGIYTEQLLKAMDQPNVPIELALKQVVSGVKRSTRGVQEPWMEGAIEGDYYFRVEGAQPTPFVAAAPPPPLPAAPAAPPPAPVGQAREPAAPVREPAKAAPPAQVALAAPTARQARKLVAIVGFENKSTYGADRLWDTSGQLLTTGLLEQGTFRLVEWERMKQLFDWHALSTNSLVKSPEKRAEARKILLTEYFISGAITQFDVTQSGEVSALSKRKVYTTNVRVDLQMQDSATGEYISGATGHSTARQEFSGDFTGGQTGAWDPKKADDALNEAIQMALKKLVDNYKRNVEAD